jgi:hypothetical protein
MLLGLCHALLRPGRFGAARAVACASNERYAVQPIPHMSQYLIKIERVFVAMSQNGDAMPGVLFEISTSVVARGTVNYRYAT